MSAVDLRRLFNGAGEEVVMCNKQEPSVRGLLYVFVFILVGLIGLGYGLDSIIKATYASRDAEIKRILEDER